MNSKRKIIKVTAETYNPEEIYIEFDNGFEITLTLTPKMFDPAFAEIKNLHMPKTDGERVYWTNGASLTVDEIITMLRAV